MVWIQNPSSRTLHPGFVSVDDQAELKASLSNMYLQWEVKKCRTTEDPQKSNMLLFPALQQKLKCKQPRGSEATACKVLYARREDGWMEQREKKRDARGRIK